ncbi:hypothetical protein GCM10010149_13590 [Nonomuraea roseoviolacea subsp. roseoviolacea]
MASSRLKVRGVRLQAYALGPMSDRRVMATIDRVLHDPPRPSPPQRVDVRRAPPLRRPSPGRHAAPPPVPERTP